MVGSNEQLGIERVVICYGRSGVSTHPQSHDNNSTAGTHRPWDVERLWAEQPSRVWEFMDLVGLSEISLQGVGQGFEILSYLRSENWVKYYVQILEFKLSNKRTVCKLDLDS